MALDNTCRIWTSKFCLLYVFLEVGIEVPVRFTYVRLFLLNFYFLLWINFQNTSLYGLLQVMKTNNSILIFQVSIETLTKKKEKKSNPVVQFGEINGKHKHSLSLSYQVT